MFDFSWGEVLLIGAVALIVIGPKDLPAALRTVGRTIGKVKRMASEFQGQFNEALREADLDKVRKDVEGMNKAASAGFNPVKTIRDEVKGAIDKPGAAKAAAASSASADNAAALSAAALPATHSVDATPAEVSPPGPVAKAETSAEPDVTRETAAKPAEESSGEPSAKKSAAGSRNKEEKDT
jgi:sec-independent protein translocase protein TatB